MHMVMVRLGKWVHDHELHCLLNGHPQRAALPGSVALGEADPKADTCAETSSSGGVGRGSQWAGLSLLTAGHVTFQKSCDDAPSRRQGCYMAGDGKRAREG